MELNWSGIAAVKTGASGCGVSLLEPAPLDDRGFEQCRGRVGVVFEQLRRRSRTAFACPGEVEASVKRGGLLVPGEFNDGDSGFGRISSSA